MMSNRIIFNLPENIKEILPSNYNYKFEEWKNDKFQINFTLTDVSSFETWKTHFEQLNKISLRILCTKKASKNYIFNKTFVCHHNAAHGVLGNGKHTGCPFKMSVLIYNSIKLFEHLCKIRLLNKHNHPLNSADVLRRLRVSHFVDDRLKELFLQGHYIKSAREILLDDIKSNTDSTEIQLADRSIFPDEPHCRRIYKKIMAQRFGEMDGELKCLLKKFIDDPSVGQYINYKQCEDGVYISICTPIMRRVHQNLESSGELVFVDSFECMDNDTHRIFLFMAHSCAGGLPLAIGITSSESESRLVNLFQLIKDVIPENSFNGRGDLGPAIFMTDDSPSELNALKVIWPKSNYLLCQFHVLQAMWQWLLNEKHGIAAKDRSYLMSFFTSLVYAMSEHEFNNRYRQMFHDEIYLKYSNFWSHIDSYLDRKEKWGLLFRKKLCTKSNNTNCIVKAAMKVLKDQIFKRKKPFNISHLVELLLFKFSDYYTLKTIDFVHGRLAQNRNNITPIACTFKYIKIDDNNYDVYSSTNNNITYHVDTSEATCTCPSGLYKEDCKHLKYFNSIDLSANTKHITLQSKAILYFISYGEHSKEGWLPPFNRVKDLNSNNQICRLNNNYQDDENFLIDELQNAQDNQPSLVQANLSKTIENCLQTFSEKINWLFSKNPTETGTALCAFKKSFESLTDSDLILALHQFAKPPRVGQKRRFVQTARHKKLTNGRPTCGTRRPLNLSYITVNKHDYSFLPSKNKLRLSNLVFQTKSHS